MSTKIYNGVMVEYMDYIQLNDYIKDLRSKLVQIAQREMLEVKAQMLEQIIVYHETGVELDSPIQDWNKVRELKGKSLRDIRFFVEREVIKIAKKNAATDTIIDYESCLDLDVKLSIMAIKGKLLGIRFIRNEMLDKAFMCSPKISDYAYWNNVDKPEHISEEDWEQREKDWNKALPGIGIPALNGFEYSIIDTLRDANKWISDYEKDIIPYLTPKDELREKIARRKLLHIKFEELKNAEDYDKEKPVSTFFEARDYVREHPEEVKKLMDELDIDVERIIKEKIKDEQC